MSHLDCLPKFTSTPIEGMQNAVEAVIAQMRRNATRTVNLDGLARHVDLNPFYLSHLFSKHVGISAKRYHQLVRISSAKHILARTEMSITNVSLECGYDSLGSFVTTFKRTVGLTPSEFRRGLLVLDSLDTPEISPKSIEAEGAAWLCVEIIAPADFEGCAFVTVCGAKNGESVDCAATSFRHRSSVTFPIASRQPLIVFAVAYSANASIRDAIIGEPALRDRCVVMFEPMARMKATLNLREAGPVDAPFVPVLPLLVRQRLDLERPVGGFQMHSQRQRRPRDELAFPTQLSRP